MAHKPILDSHRAYTFSQYFDLNADVFDGGAGLKDGDS